MKKNFLLMIVLSFALLTACSNNQDLQTATTNKNTDTKNSRQFVQAFGKIKAGEIKDISLDFPVKLKKVLIKNGQQVKEGDELIQINKEDYDAAVYYKEHELNIINQDTSTPLKIRNEKKAICQKELDILKNKAVNSNLSQNKIISDCKNGIAYDLNYFEGDRVEAGQKILSIAALDTLIVQADVVEEFIKDVKVGSDVEIIPLADKEKVYKGKVQRISNKAFAGTNGETTVPVEISITDKDDFLKPEFNVEVTINK